jgi:crotonyl-CoA carboxylase/reductase
MVVICVGTTDYSAIVYLSYRWTRQKRLQDSHGTNDVPTIAYNRLVCDSLIDPSLSRVGRFEDIPQVHQDMGKGVHSAGNTTVLVGAPQPELGRE